MRRPLSSSLAAAVIFVSSAARAQIVNVQPLLAGVDHDGPSGALEASADGRSGNTRLTLLSAALIARYKSGPNVAFLLAKGDYGVQKGDRFIDRDLEHLRYRRALVAPLEVEVFTQHERDAFRRVALRALVGAGPRLHFVVSPIDAGLGVAYLGEYQELKNDTLADAGATSFEHRMSTYGTFFVRTSDTIKLGQTLYWQPRFDRFSDFRLLSETELVGSFTSHISVKVTLSMAYDSAPPLGVQSFDASRKVSLALNL
jgi:hypothetical protein